MPCRAQSKKLETLFYRILCDLSWAPNHHGSKPGYHVSQAGKETLTVLSFWVSKSVYLLHSSQENRDDTKIQPASQPADRHLTYSLDFAK